MGRGLSDPSWKSGPTHPEPTASDHAIHPEDFGSSRADWDGFGVDEAEAVEGEPLVALMESASCSRDGCDASHRRRLLFTTHTLTDEEEARLRRHLDLSTDEELGVHVHENGERVDVETIEVAPPEGGTIESDGEASDEVDGIGISVEKVMEDEPRGSCYGRVEPEPDVNAHRYDL